MDREIVDTYTDRQWANLFEITNQDELSLAYRVMEIRGLPRGEEYDKNINQLTKGLAYEIQQPVALVKRGDSHFVAIPASGPLPELERKLMPHVASLVPEKETHLLRFSRLDEETIPIAISFLQFAIQSPLWNDWSI